MKKRDWQTLTRLTGGADFEVERVRMVDDETAIEGRFELPPLARLSAEDQVFVAAFVRCHGSIKQMEKYFGVSYPTIKNRLNRIGSSLSFVEPAARGAEADRPAAAELLSRLGRGEMTVDAVVAALAKKKEELS